MIVVTGAFGFIGSCLVRFLNEKGYEDIIVVDDFYKDYKNDNLEKNKKIREWIHREIFLNWFESAHSNVDFVFHLGARTDTTSTNKSVFDELNLEYSKSVWELCTKFNIPLVYASSAATYGDGKLGYVDDHKVVSKLKPLNAYAKSKNNFDQWALKQKTTPPFWAGLKFFNVYGPNEYHKDRMASVIYHAVQQIKFNGDMKLFKSHKKGIKDGEQKRDFIYVKDVVNICHFFYKNQKKSGLYNVGTGKARSFNDLTKATFKALNLTPQIKYIDTPADIRKNYQYFTEANLKKLKAAGYKKKFYSLEDGIKDYVQKYLKTKEIW